MNYKMISTPLISLLFILHFSIVGCNNYQTEKNCCELANSELEYDIQCKNFQDSYCLQIGKIVRIDAPSLIAFSKYKSLDEPYPDTSYQTIIEDGKGIIQRDTTINYSTLYLEEIFSYKPSSFDFSNKIEISMKKNDIHFSYLGKSERIEYDSVSKSNVYRVMQILENTKELSQTGKKK